MKDFLLVHFGTFSHTCVYVCIPGAAEVPICETVNCVSV